MRCVKCGTRLKRAAAYMPSPNLAITTPAGPVMSGTIDNWRGIPLTDWFDVATQQPAKVGVYQAQDHTMRCGGCWFDAHWDGREWHTDLFDFEVKRWRGLAKRHNVGGEAHANEQT